MAEISLAVICLIVVTVYIIATLIVGYYGYKRTKLTPVDYFLGGRELGTFVLAMTFIATYASMWTFMGAVGANYRIGISFHQCMITWNTLWPLMLLAMGTRMWVLGSKYGYITPSDMFADYYDSKAIGVIASIIGLIALVPYMAIQLMGAGLAFEAATGGAIPYWAGSLYVVIAIGIYTFIGGLRAVAWTDVLQGIFFLGFLWAVMIPWVLSLSGGPAAVAAANPGIFQAGKYAYGQWLGFVLTWGLSPLLPHMLQRCFMAKSPKVILRSAALLFILSAWVQSVSVALTGSLGTAIIPGLKGVAADQFIVMFMAKYSPILGTVVVAAALAAGMSTLDSQLLSSSSLLTRDIYVKYVRPKASELEEARIGQIFVLVLTALMWVLSLYTLTPLVVLGTAGAAICVAGYFFPAIGCLFWPRPGKIAALGGLLAGGAAALATFWTMPFGFHNAVWGFVVGGIAFLALAFVTPPPSPEKQRKFHGLFSKAIYGIE
ncbi:MAG: sodium:solute symporter family protein [Candidatus Bathyarchaeia archaeon]